MFTGIIQATGRITTIRTTSRGTDLTLTRPKSFRAVRKGASIAVDGVCLTLQRFTATTLVFHCSPHTLAVTRLGSVHAADWVNLERPLRVGEEFGGHIVSGHVDGLGIVKKEKTTSGRWLNLELPVDLIRYCAVRGSITVNGVSLTIATQKGRTIAATLIPTTLEKTNLGDLKPGDRVNIEVDLIARYLEQILKLSYRNDKRRT